MAIYVPSAIPACVAGRFVNSPSSTRFSDFSDYTILPIFPIAPTLLIILRIYAVKVNLNLLNFYFIIGRIVESENDRRKILRENRRIGRIGESENDLRKILRRWLMDVLISNM